MTTGPNLNWIDRYIRGIAEAVLRDVYVRTKYRDVILPMTVLRRLDAESRLRGGLGPGLRATRPQGRPEAVPAGGCHLHRRSERAPDDA